MEVRCSTEMSFYCDTTESVTVAVTCLIISYKLTKIFYLIITVITLILFLSEALKRRANTCQVLKQFPTINQLWI